MVSLSLADKVAIVTGGSKGIGRRIAEVFAEAGATVAVAARGQEDLTQTAKEIEAAGGRALPIVTDVSEPEQVKALIERTVGELGTIDILVNNAGSAPFISTLDQIRESGFEKYFRINFLGALYASKYAAPVLLSKGGGCVLNVASVAGYIASPGLTYYSTAKAALINLTRTLALEWASSKVRVNAVAPGWVETEMNVVARQNPAFYDSALNSIPLGRWGRADDVANAALFLCSPAASFITGATLVIDGGQTVTALSTG
ncbi:MAG: SDR family NAD(P)-dependent oxidoreductase [Actinomycetota bacterium]